jgi:hypothetical protein
MAKSDEYRTKLRSLDEWDRYLLKESGLPGPRGNIELAQAVADEGDRALFERYMANTAEKAPVNTPGEFLAFCGTVGLGRLLAEGDAHMLAPLRAAASDTRWRMREGVAMALQRFGAADMNGLLAAMKDWSRGTPLEQRAAAAALCEPALLREARHVKATLKILDTITASLARSRDRKSDDFVALRKGLAYCWSVAAAALPAEGKPLMEKWIASSDKDVRWIMKENLKKNRLVRVEPEWVERQLALIAQ